MMNKELIIESINKLFLGVDERDWELVSQVLGHKVFFDYTSMSGGEPAELPASQIIETWKSFLPGFDKTHHQTGNFVVSEVGGLANAVCYATAVHFLDNESKNNIWTVVGTYNFELKKDSFAWKITKMKFNLKFSDGNSKISELAAEKMRK